MKGSNAIRNLMESNGYVLSRQKNHCIWINERGQKITTSRTASDNRALQNVMKTIRAQEKAATLG